MKIWDCIITAIRALTSNKLRSVLTMLGTLIGVAVFPLWLDFVVLLILSIALATLGGYFFSRMEAD